MKYHIAYYVFGTYASYIASTRFTADDAMHNWLIGSAMVFAVVSLIGITMQLVKSYEPKRCP